MNWRWLSIKRFAKSVIIFYGRNSHDVITKEIQQEFACRSLSTENEEGVTLT